MPGISKEDRELADAARKKAGSVTALALHFKVKVQTASGWGRRYSIPRHLRPRLTAYVEGQSSTGTTFAAAISPDSLSPDEVALMADATGHEAFRKLAVIFKNRRRRPKLWTAITHNLDAFAEMAEGAVTARRRVTRPTPVGDVKTRRRP